MKKIAAITLFLLIPVFTQAAVTTQNYAQYNAPYNSNLVSYWKFDENGGVSAIDSTSHGHTGTYKLFPTWSTAVASQINFKDPYALSVDGLTQWVDVGIDNAFKLSNFTISAWVYPINTSGGSGYAIFNTGFVQSSAYFNTEFYLDTAYKLNFISPNGGASTVGVIYNNPIPLNTWTHVAVTYNGTSHIATLYVNGKNVASNNVGVVQYDSTYYRATIGAKSWSGGLLGSVGQYFDQKYDELRVFNRVLSDSEMFNLYNASRETLAASQPPFLNNGLVLYQTMDASDLNYTNGTTVDRSRKGNSGTLVGYTNATTTAYKAGKVGSALSFNGSSQYVSVPNSSSLNPSGDLSISAWVKTSIVGVAGKNIIAKGNGNDYFQQYEFQIGGDNKVYFVIGNSTNNGYYILNTPSAVLSSGWNNVTATLSDTSANIYVNGVLDSSASGSGSRIAANSNPVFIGGRQDNSTYFNGSIDDVRVYNRALSAYEVTQLYQSGQAVIARSQPSFINNGLVGNWTMNGNDFTYSNGQFADRSGQGNSGTVVGYTNATTTMLKAGVTGSALSFNGSSQYLSLVNTSSLRLTSWTISAWVKPTVMQTSFIIDNEKSGSINYYLRYAADGTAEVDFYDGTHRFIDSAAGAIKPGVWTHILGMYNGATLSLYLNGVGIQAITYNLTPPTPSDSTIRIGTRFNNTGYTNGLIDDVRIYNRALSPYEITRLYQAKL
jgi:hypothetical protein